MNIAQYIVARLKDVGVRHVFTVPGDYASPFLDVLDASDGIARIATIAELGAGYAADGYGRYGGVGACCLQYGVGSFSALAAVAGSYVERVPVVVISASPSTSDRMLERTQRILFHHSTGDLQADRKVFDNVTVASLIVDDPLTGPARIDAAFTAMLTHRRPIYIEVLKNVWTLNCAEPQGTLKPVVTPSDPAALSAALDAAWARLRAAKQPVIWAGVQIARFGLRDTLQKLIDSSGLPFTTTSLGKTVLDETQAQFIGTYASQASPPATWDYMQKADCILALGTIITDDYLAIMASSYGAMIEVTEEEVRIGYQHYRQVTMADFIQGLLDRFAGTGALTVVPPERPTVPARDVRLTYNSFMHALADFMRQQGLLDKTALVLGESTALYVFGNLLGLPRDAFCANAAWGSLGHETGAALGIMLGSDKRAFVVAGDGGFRMVCQELSSLAAQKLNAIVFVMSNNVYAIEQAFVDPKAFTPEGSFAPFDILPVWDYGARARAFGAAGYRAQTTDELTGVLHEAVAITDRPVLIEVVIPEKDFAPQLARLAGVTPPLRKANREGT